MAPSAVASPPAAELVAYRAVFARAQADRPGPVWLRGLREAALGRAEALGFPRPDDEEWRFTSVAPIARTTFGVAPADGVALADELRALRFGGAFAGHEIVFVNGRLAPELSSVDPAAGVRLLSLAETLDREPGLLEPHLARIAEGRGFFESLNTALAEDGAVVVIAPAAVVERPIHLLFLSAPGGETGPTMSHVRTLILGGRGSQASVVQTWAGGDGATYLTTSVTEVVQEEDAVLDHYRLQQEGAGGLHVSSLHVRQARNSRFLDHALLLGGALSRNDATVRLQGPGAECALDGLFLATGTQHVDAHTVIDHVQPHCSSRELYNGVLDGRARGVFHGRIVVRPDAQKTSAYQANHNLLLSREALVNSTPALEIRADDVKCKHGSTTGQIDPQSLFYLRSRGIDEAAARALLVHAFAAEVTGRVALPAVRQRLQALIARRLPGAPAEVES